MGYCHFRFLKKKCIEQIFRLSSNFLKLSQNLEIFLRCVKNLDSHGSEIMHSAFLPVCVMCSSMNYEKMKIKKMKKLHVNVDYLYLMTRRLNRGVHLTSADDNNNDSCFRDMMHLLK